MDWKKQFLEYAFPLKRINMEQDSAQALLDKNRPRYLYKYRNADKNGFSVLETGSIWMARPDTLNDPYDCWYSYGGDEVVEIYERNLRRKYPDTPQHFVDEWRKDSRQRLIDGNNKLRETFRNTVKLCSLSESKNIDKMWQEYANNHTGFCIEFDINSSDKDIVQDVFPVYYSNDRIDFSEYMDLVFSDKAQVNGKFIRNALLIKELKWLPEREWRIVRPDDSPVSGIKLSGLHISGVFLGKNMSEKDEKHIHSICQQKDIPVKP